MAQHDLMATAVEAHGVICGLVCGGVALDDKSWQPHFNDLINDGFGLPAPVRQVMTDLYHEVIESLMAQKGVELLLPSDEAPLDERIDSLVDWSQAFLAGFGVVQQELSKASEELQEMIQDIASITRSLPSSIRKMKRTKPPSWCFTNTCASGHDGVRGVWQAPGCAEHAADPALICPPTGSMKERITALFLFCTRGESREALCNPWCQSGFARGFIPSATFVVGLAHVFRLCPLLMSQSDLVHVDVAIVGGGMKRCRAGLLPCRPERTGWRPLQILLLEASAPELNAHPGFDARAIALSAGTCEALARHGLWPHLVPHCSPITHIHVSDRGHCGQTRLSAAGMVYPPSVR